MACVIKVRCYAEVYLVEYLNHFTSSRGILISSIPYSKVFLSSLPPESWSPGMHPPGKLFLYAVWFLLSALTKECYIKRYLTAFTLFSFDMPPSNKWSRTGLLPLLRLLSWVLLLRICQQRLVGQGLYTIPVKMGFIFGSIMSKKMFSISSEEFSLRL